MKAVKISCLPALVALMAGCATQYPQNAEEFRRQVPGALMGKVQTFEAHRPFRDVARTFQAKATECLNVSVRAVEQGGGSYSRVVTTTYKPTVVVGERKAELHVQRHYQGSVLIPGKEPEGGLYALVADAVPLDNSRTRIDIYGPSRGVDPLVKAITGWATGQNLGCPDLTKN